MPLTAAHKAVLDSFDDVDKSLAVLYIFGVDDNALASKLGTSFVREFYPDLNPAQVPNARKARAFLLAARAWVKGIHVKNSGESAARDAEQSARDTAAAEVPYRDIGQVENG